MLTTPTHYLLSQRLLQCSWIHLWLPKMNIGTVNIFGKGQTEFSTYRIDVGSIQNTYQRDLYLISCTRSTQFAYRIEHCTICITSFWWRKIANENTYWTIIIFLNVSWFLNALFNFLFVYWYFISNTFCSRNIYNI